MNAARPARAVSTRITSAGDGVDASGPLSAGGPEAISPDVTLNGERTGSTGLGLFPLDPARSTTDLSADGHAHIPVVLWEQPSALGFSPGWWLDAPSGLLVLLVVAAAVGLPLAALLKRELKRPEVERSASGFRPLDADRWAAGAASPQPPCPGGPTP